MKEDRREQPGRKPNLKGDVKKREKRKTLILSIFFIPIPREEALWSVMSHYYH